MTNRSEGKRIEMGTLRLSMLVLVAVWCTTASAQILVTSDVTGQPGSWTYRYSIENIGSSTIMALALNAVGDVSMPTAPPNWEVFNNNVEGITRVFWGAEDLPFGVAPGGTVTRFSFQSALAPGNTQLTALDDQLSEWHGQTVAPVPEPASLCALGIGTLFLWRKRRHAELKAR